MGPRWMGWLTSGDATLPEPCREWVGAAVTYRGLGRSVSQVSGLCLRWFLVVLSVLLVAAVVGVLAGRADLGEAVSCPLANACVGALFASSLVPYPFMR